MLVHCWDTITNTPINKYDLINNINVRGSFVLSKEWATNMVNRGKGGHIIMHSPPLPNPDDTRIYKGKTGYMISKYGMTMTAMGISEEYRNDGIAQTLYGQQPRLKLHSY